MSCWGVWALDFSKPGDPKSPMQVISVQTSGPDVGIIYPWITRVQVVGFRA